MHADAPSAGEAKTRGKAFADGPCLSRLLSLLDLFRAFDADANATASIDVAQLGPLAKTFVTDARKDLEKAVNAHLSVDLTEKKTGVLGLSSEKKKPLTNAHVRKLVEAVETQLAKPGLFDYDTIMQKVVEGCKRVLKDVVGKHVEAVAKDIGQLDCSVGRGFHGSVRGELHGVGSREDHLLPQP